VRGETGPGAAPSPPGNGAGLSRPRVLGANGVSHADRLEPRGRARAVAPTATGVSFDPLLPFEAWCVAGARIARHSSASAWWLGDWLVFGQSKYGRRYQQAVATTGLEYQTLRNYAVVARRFEASRRRDALTFQHHAEVCALDDAEQDRWLDLAAINGWSKNELRRQLRSARNAGLRQLPRSGATAPLRDAMLRLTVAPESEARWRAAAERRGCPFEDWVLEVLDDAARSTPAAAGQSQERTPAAVERPSRREGAHDPSRARKCTASFAAEAQPVHAFDVGNAMGARRDWLPTTACFI
jgi:hypothetical protein